MVYRDMTDLLTPEIAATHVRSQDGTAIAYTRAGEGPPLVIVDGALCHRAFGPSSKVAALLSASFTVYTYDRRGRGASGDTPPSTPEREVEDLEAVIDAAGGSAYVVGFSSGAALAMETARRGPAIEKLALYEAPFVVDGTHAPMPDDFVARMDAAIAAGRPGDAVKQFMRWVGTPGVFVAAMQVTPIWRKLKAVGHTLPYDMALVEPHHHGRPLERED